MSLKSLHSLEVVRERRGVGEGEGFGSQECSHPKSSLLDATVLRTSLLTQLMLS